MSLREAVLEVADQMEAEAKDACNSDVASTLKGFARQLRSAVKASGSDFVTREPLQPGGVETHPHEYYVQQERRRIREERAARGEVSLATPSEGQRADDLLTGSEGGLMVAVEDGPAFCEGVATMVSIHPSMPLGARTLVQGHIYLFKEVEADGKKRKGLFHDVEMELKRKELQNGSPGGS